jgi:hypothetical protein
MRRQRIFWAILIVLGVIITFGAFDGQRSGEECSARGGVPVWQGRSLYPICFNPAALK